MAVQIEINAKNMELSDKLRDYVETKVGKLDRYLDIIDQAQVDLTHAKTARNAKDRQVAQLTIRGKGQIERYKGRHWRSRGDGRSAAEVASYEPLPSEEEDDPSEMIVRRKRHFLIPMDESEAVEQMQLLGHEDFFIFLDIVNNQVNILYRRRDGTLGLIETENK
jgi:putative sigma-54 modulation protein